MQDRQQHEQEVEDFLQRHFSDLNWEFSIPKGSGNETYLARSNNLSCFVKLGVQPARYQAMASMDLTPEVLAAGSLQDGTSIIVQAYTTGRTPTRSDYRLNLEQFATVINRVHHNHEVRMALPQVSSDDYRIAGQEALARLQEKWTQYKTLVPQVVDFIDESLAYLGEQVKEFQGTGLVASHNDICNANWIITPDGQLYLVDLESMSIDDPALDIGATLWWYYPPELRQRFLQIVGHASDKAFDQRMHVRMAMHCLNILLPRQSSFDRFDSISFSESLADFKAILAGEENPEGFDD